MQFLCIYTVSNTVSYTSLQSVQRMLVTLHYFDLKFKFKVLNLDKEQDHSFHLILIEIFVIAFAHFHSPPSLQRITLTNEAKFDYHSEETYFR